MYICRFDDINANWIKYAKKGNRKVYIRKVTKMEDGYWLHIPQQLVEKKNLTGYVVVIETNEGLNIIPLDLKDEE